MPLTQLDRPNIARVVDRLYGAIENKNCDRSLVLDCFAELGLSPLDIALEDLAYTAVVGYAIDSVRSTLTPSQVFGNDCPDITDSDLDELLKIALVKLWGELGHLDAAHQLSNNSVVRLQFCEFLSTDLLPALRGSQPPQFESSKPKIRTMAPA